MVAIRVNFLIFVDLIEILYLECRKRLGNRAFLMYRVGHLLADLGWVDLDLDCSTIMLGQ